MNKKKENAITIEKMPPWGTDQRRLKNRPLSTEAIIGNRPSLIEKERKLHLKNPVTILTE